MRTILFALFLFGSLYSPECMGQRTKKVKEIKGEWIISKDITPQEANAFALQEAKTNALRAAGVPEFVAQSDLQFLAETKGDVQEAFNSLTTVDVSGEIKRYEIVREESGLNDLGQFRIQVWIDAEVVIHKAKKDPGLDLSIKGIRESYYSPENISFEVTPTKDGYLSIFMMDGTDAALIYPNIYEKQERLKASETISFPRSAALDYEVSTDQGIEVNYLLLLYTKSEVPYIKEQTTENILSFIAAISPSEKTLKTFSFVVKE